MKQVKILGPGCKRCDALISMVKQAADKSGIEVSVEKVTDYAEIAKAGVASTPGLVIDGNRTPSSHGSRHDGRTHCFLRLPHDARGLQCAAD